MNEKNILVAIIAGLSFIFIITIIMMLKWAKSRPALCEAIYRKSDAMIRTRKYRFILLGAYVFPICVPHAHAALRLSLMSLVFLLLFPFGIKFVVGRTKGTQKSDISKKGFLAKSPHDAVGDTDVQ